MKFLLIEPFFGGSHKDFAEGLKEHSRYRIDLLTLPARFWKWRMRGAAINFAKRLPAMEDYDGIIVSDLLGLADLKALSKEPLPPVLAYFHENQLSYPLAPGEKMDYQFAFTNITTALAADRILFNSRYHHDAFFDALPGFLRMMPDARVNWVSGEIRARSEVLYPGCRFAPRKKNEDPPEPAGDPPVIIWNHRWEFDKNPGDFFHALDLVAAEGIPFRLALLGENFQNIPPEFGAAREKYGSLIAQYGYVKSRREYLAWLRKGAVVISTAIQENFGISVVEAVRFGCMPLLPDRLSYPEIIPEEFHDRVLYENPRDLAKMLSRILRNPRAFQETVARLSRCMGGFSWENRIEEYDRELENLACRAVIP